VIVSVADAAETRIHPNMAIQDAAKTRPQEGGASFSLGNRLTRALWVVTWALLASWTPPQLVAWRRMLLRLFGATVAPTANIRGTAKIWLPSNLEMHDYATLGPRANCYNMAKVTLGRYAIVSQGAHLCAGSHRIDDEHFQLVAKPIAIGERAWIAAEAFVGPGVTVGEGAVLGARGVAFENLRAWTVYIGNPAAEKRARKRIG
jgi:putative colanic acid biosynthesis acetyltransferase WcaF